MKDEEHKIPNYAELTKKAVQLRTDKGIEQVICLKDDYDDKFRDACKEEYLIRQTKLS